VIGDACKYFTQVELGIEAVEASSTDQRIDGSGTFAPGVGR